MRTGAEQTEHLSQEELELLLPLPDSGGIEARPRSELKSHLEGCARCRRARSTLRSLHSALASVPRPEPSPGFVHAVMERVRLPVPWYARARHWLTEHWLAAAAAVLLAGGAVGGSVYWISVQPELTLGGLVDFTFDRMMALLWAFVLTAARLLWASGIPDLLQAAARQLSWTEAAIGMTMVTLMASGAGAFLLKLLTAPPAPRYLGRS